MAGGLLQIITYGAQDVYLTDNPHITFFKIVYRRHTDFSFEVFEHPILNNINFGSKNAITLSRNGDLITNMYLKIVIDSFTPNPETKFAWTRRLGHAILKSFEIEIGGVTMDKHIGVWLDIWFELTQSDKNKKGYLKMIGDVPEMTEYNNKTKPEYTIYIPIKFWFNRHTGLALPLISIQYHDIIFRIELNDVSKLIITNKKFNQLDSLKILHIGLVVDYVYLNETERRHFALNDHEYLIEQVQFTGEEHGNNEISRYQLHFNHPTKELFWAMRHGNYITNKKFLCYTHEDNWNKIIEKCAIDILKNSIILLKATVYNMDMSIAEPGDDPPTTGIWEEFEPGSDGTTINGKINVNNDSTDKSLWINTGSLMIETYNITDKISGTIDVSDDNTITMMDISSTITLRDISIPVERMTDTRIDNDDVCVNQFSNYGTLIDGSHNPINYAQLEFNRHNRFDKRNWKFFNYAQPELYHSNSPKDGINVYSFCINPELHQPTGTANFSKIEHITLTLWLKDRTKNNDDLPLIKITNLDNIIYIFAFSYNILRVSHGLTGISYNG